MTSIAPKTIRFALSSAILGLSVIAHAGPVAAQSGDDPAAQSGEASPAMQKLQKKRRAIRELTQELRQIQKQATQSNPELQDDTRSYQDMVMQAMTDDNYNPKAEVKRIRSLQADLQGGGDLSDKERRNKIRTLEEKKQQFRRKQQQAMKIKDVQDARKELDRKMQAAMKEQDPQAGELIAQLNQLHQEYKELLRKTMMQQQGSSQGEGQDQG